jgi:hypothetical protein
MDRREFFITALIIYTVIGVVITVIANIDDSLSFFGSGPIKKQIGKSLYFDNSGAGLGERLMTSYPMTFMWPAFAFTVIRARIDLMRERNATGQESFLDFIGKGDMK